jgi:peptidyl-lysine (3S)-dioxygenase / protease
LFFYKKFISKNRPCIIEGGNEDWKAMENWTDLAYLREKLEKEISVDLTPDGFADSIHGNYFV